MAGKTRACDVLRGMRLACEFGGKVHVVTVGEGGKINWNGKEWRSLSEVARAITGTRWSGPACSQQRLSGDRTGRANGAELRGFRQQANYLTSDT